MHSHPVTRDVAIVAFALPTILGAQAPAKVRPSFVDGMAQIVPAFADSTQWIRQELWVQTNFDSDHDGKPDRVHVDVTRPRQTQTEGLKVPIIYGSSPYYAGTARGQVNWDVNQELDEQPKPREPMTKPAYRADRSRISNALVNEWVPRGFAVVHSEAPGTGRSQGCPTVGDIPERMPMKFVVDWLNGRAKGFTTETGNEEVKATWWSSGKVGMIYKSLTKGGNYDSKRLGEPLKPGTFYDLTFDLQPDDEIVPPGKQLAVMIMSSDREFTLWPKAGTELTLDLAHSSFTIPIVGGAAAMRAAMHD